MPEVIRRPQRGTVSLFGNVYFKGDLHTLIPEKAQVRVRYDLHDASKVKLLTMDGVFIGEALWKGNTKASFPVPEIEKLRLERAQRRAKNGERIIAEAQAELGDIIDQSPAITIPVAQPDYMPEPAEEPSNQPSMSHEELVMWLYPAKEDETEDEPPEQKKSETGADAPISAVAGR